MGAKRSRVWWLARALVVIALVLVPAVAPAAQVPPGVALAAPDAPAFMPTPRSWLGGKVYVAGAGWALPPGDGVKTVWVRVRDDGGTLSAPASDTIVLDQQPPKGIVTIDGTVPPTGTPSTRYELSLSASDTGSGVVGMRLSHRSDFAGAGWQPFAITMPLGQEPTSYAFRVRRQTAGQATTLYLTLLDGCGSCSTFVGGGAGAFQAPGLPAGSRRLYVPCNT